MSDPRHNSPTSPDVSEMGRMWPFRGGRLRRAQRRWDWWQTCTSSPWVVGHWLSQPRTQVIQPDPINLGMQLGYYGA